MSTEQAGRFPTLRRKAALFVAVLTALLVVSCGSESEPGAPAMPSVTEAAAKAEHEGLSITVPGTLAADIAELTKNQQGRLGLAIMPVGGQRVVTFGDWTTGPAWSTMKVPLAIAALRKSQGSPSYSTTAAITASDNSAADALWQSLGSPQEAAQAVQAVLREGGDATTTVPAIKARAEFSAFGQSEWALADQVRFASRLPCLAESADVVSLMGQIIPNHQWGLGSVFETVDFKGGWGPDSEGAYLVRQFGLVPAPGGQIAVALAAEPASGNFSDGMSTLNKMATLISQHLGELSGGQCAA
ncbi:hypothetical protein [Nocardia cyriacigeorgica]|uniref:hypothetical protein n=1 Tax=Nocardia cyriacigeorgica TaxID=135487 RepID=UPI002113C54E|nr:hypothetical protein [Nocardia cyriacigeorgica]